MRPVANEVSIGTSAKGKESDLASGVVYHTVGRRFSDCSRFNLCLKQSHFLETDQSQSKVGRNPRSGEWRWKREAVGASLGTSEQGEMEKRIGRLGVTAVKRGACGLRVGQCSGSAVVSSALEPDAVPCGNQWDGKRWVARCGTPLAAERLTLLRSVHLFQGLTPRRGTIVHHHNNSPHFLRPLPVVQNAKNYHRRASEPSPARRPTAMTTCSSAIPFRS